MRSAIALILALALAWLPAVAAAPAEKRHETGRPTAEFTNSESLLRWINGYRVRPDASKVPVAVHAMSDLGLFRDLDQAGVYIGFMAGVLQVNPKTAEDLVSKMFPMPPEDQVAIIRADRLFRAARLEGPDAQVRRAHARAQGADRPVRLRQAADTQADLAGFRAGAARHAVGPILRHGSYEPVLRMVSVLTGPRSRTTSSG